MCRLLVRPSRLVCREVEHLVRDVNRCSSDNFSRDPIKSRDVNAAISIMNCGRKQLAGEVRDNIFTDRATVKRFCMNFTDSFFKKN